MTDQIQAIVDIYAEIIKRGVSPEGSAVMAAALVVVRELDTISDMLDSIDTRLLAIVSADE